MNDFDLESRLKSVPVPERTEEYWEEFPSQIRVQLRRRPSPAPARRALLRPLLIWSMDFALAVALIFVCVECHPLQTFSAAVTRQHNYWHRQFAQFDAGLHKLVLNTDGMGYLIVDAN